MHHRNRRRNGPLQLNSEINITNLVDVAFVLLIIFIITAPILQGGIDVQLPKADAAPITKPDGLIVSLTADRKIFVGDVPVATIEEFELVYPQIVKSNNTTDAYIKADAKVLYEDFLQVLGAMKRLDVAEVGLVSDPNLERRR